MPHDADNTIKELSKQRESAAKTALLWIIPGVIGVMIGATKDMMTLWHEAGGDFKKFFTPKNPTRLLKNPVAGIAYVIGLGSLLTGFVYAVKGKAFGDSIKQIRADQQSTSCTSASVTQLPDTGKQWAADELLKKDMPQALTK